MELLNSHQTGYMRLVINSWVEAPICIPLWPYPHFTFSQPLRLDAGYQPFKLQLGAPESQLMASQFASIYSHAAHSAQTRCNYWRRMRRGHLLLGSARLGPRCPSFRGFIQLGWTHKNFPVWVWKGTGRCGHRISVFQRRSFSSVSSSMHAYLSSPGLTPMQLILSRFCGILGLQHPRFLSSSVYPMMLAHTCGDAVCWKTCSSVHGGTSAA